ncbi:MAG: alpha/beta hydrolase [Spirochaetales bacterium]|nr:alpha/beta hydrolase [Spirochaetales bacterium]
MNYEKIKIENQEIALYRKGSGKITIFFVYGQISSIDLLEHQFNGRLSEKFSIAAIDLPGHGYSSPAKTPEETYTFPGYAGIISKTVEYLGLKKVIYVGHSIGGHILLQSSDKLPAMRGLMVFGSTPFKLPPAFDQAFLPHPVSQNLFNADISEDIAQKWVEGVLKTGSQIPEFLPKVIERIDPVSRSVMGASIANGNLRNEVELAEKLHFPLAILHGRHDQLINSEYLEQLNISTSWKNRIHYLEEAGHSPQWETPDEFNRLIEEYAREVCG